MIQEIGQEEIFITITIEEYKELLITKGKYEELRNKCWQCYPRGTAITYGDSGTGLHYPYKVTCTNTISQSSSADEIKKGE